MNPGEQVIKLQNEMNDTGAYISILHITHTFVL